MPDPVLGSWRQGEWSRLEQGFAESALQILAGEAPGEEFAEGVNRLREFIEAGVVIRREHLALDDRE